ncbi:MAG: hypothetical protein PHN80_10175 [Hespellia sp.]|nr:hypothetical protein [Hespellia sp.]
MNNKRKIVKVVIALIIALISIFGVTRFATSTNFHAKSIEALDDKRGTVMELAAASTAASAAITLIPGDTATPIAEKLADLSSYFLIVLCAIFLEKYLLTITGYAAFMILIPAACLLYAANVFLENEMCKYLVRKIAVFGLAIFLVVPASIKVSNLIEKTYDSSVEATIQNAKDTTEEIGESTEEEEDGSIVSQIISKVKGGVTEVTQKLENVLSNFVEAIAVMIVTSCIIPILVLLFFIWLIKVILGVNISIPGGLPGRKI